MFRLDHEQLASAATEPFAQLVQSAGPNAELGGQDAVDFANRERPGRRFQEELEDPDEEVIGFRADLAPEGFEADS